MAVWVITLYCYEIGWHCGRSFQPRNKDEKKNRKEEGKRKKRMKKIEKKKMIGLAVHV
jgi:hypothetical protein